MVMILAVIGLVMCLLPWVIVFLVLSHQRRLRDLTARIGDLERELQRGRGPHTPAVPSQTVIPPQAEFVPPPAAVQGLVPIPVPAPAPAASIPPPGSEATSSPPRPRSRFDEETRRAEPWAHIDPTRLEQQIGGIWLQNVGSVLLLLGAFFLIVWGYATRRIGPEVLVFSGVLLGVFVAWRGAVIARSVTALGNALIGVGLGTMYITLYVGHFRMGVLPGWAAFSSITFVALATVAIGLRRKEPIIATLGVVGAFLPQLLAVWIPLQGFGLALPTLLGYFAVVNGVVFTLAATVGWSGLAILSMLLTTWTWAANAHGGWSFAIQMGLTALFAGIGLAPVVRLVRVPAPVRNVDLLVVALAPLLLLLSSIPYLLDAGRLHASWILIGLTVLYGGGAIWVESRRERRDLWKPLTGAATVFLAAALERGIDPEHLAMAWAVEGAVLVALGLGPGRDAWLRYLGYGVSFLSGCWLTVTLLAHWGAGPRFLSLSALRDLFCVAVLLVVSHLVGRWRERLTEEERGWVPGWSVVSANLLLMVWVAREANRLREALPAVTGREGAGVTFAIVGAAWALHSLALIFLGRRPGHQVLRHTGYMAGTFGAIAFLTAYGIDSMWKPPAPPFSSFTALLGLFTISLVMAASSLLGRDRERLGPAEESMPEGVTVAGHVLLMVWVAREASRLRTTLPGLDAPDAVMAAWTLTAVGWLVQGLVLVLLSRRSRASALRPVGYIVSGMATVALWIGHASGDVWRTGQPPFLNPTAITAGLAIVLLIATSEVLWRGRDRLGSDRRAPEITAAVANAFLLLWWAREAGHLAAVLGSASGDEEGGWTLASVFTSAFWTIHAITLFAVGWLRNSAFLRWSGLILFGLTVVKFLAVDLDRVDAFWRFAGAVGIGAALLVISFLYQRRTRRIEETGGGSQVSGS